MNYVVAEREGFEPSMELLTPYSLSRGAPSASRPSLQHEAGEYSILLGTRKQAEAEIFNFIECPFILLLVPQYHQLFQGKKVCPFPAESADRFPHGVPKLL